MDDKRKFALIRGDEKFTLEDVKYLAKTFKAKYVALNECDFGEDGTGHTTYGILLTRTTGSTDFSMLRKLFGIYDKPCEHIQVFNIPLALYLGIVGQEDSYWQMEELFSSEEIEEYQKEYGDDE